MLIVGTTATVTVAFVLALFCAFMIIWIWLAYRLLSRRSDPPRHLPKRQITSKAEDS